MKKRILSLLMAVALMLSCIAIPAAAAESTPKTLKVLTIGNSYSIDSMSYLSAIFKAEGDDTQLTLGNLYVSGQSIAGHWEYAQNDKTYIYYKDTTGRWETVGDYTIRAALQDEDWDIIVMQESSGNYGLPSTFNNGNLDNLIAYVQQHKTNPDAKLYWNLVWSYQKTYNSSAFQNHFNEDQYFYFECIVNTHRDQIATRRPIFSGMFPSGSAIQNARATIIGDNLNRDGYHLNSMGRVIVGYTWYSVLTGKTLGDAIRYTDVRAESSTPAITITPEQAHAVAQAVNAAVADSDAGVRSMYQLQAGDVFYLPYPPTVVILQLLVQ